MSPRQARRERREAERKARKAELKRLKAAGAPSFSVTAAIDAAEPELEQEFSPEFLAHARSVRDRIERRVSAERSSAPGFVPQAAHPSSSSTLPMPSPGRDQAAPDSGFVSQNARTSNPSRAQINRHNAQHSTGPRTPDGKLASSRNSLKHGLASGTLLIPGEDAAAFEALRVALLEEHQPATETEGLLIQEMAQSFWLTQRAIRLQNECFTAEGVDQKQLSLFLRYQTTHERAFYKALNTLLRLKQSRAREQAVRKIGFVSQPAGLPTSPIHHTEQSDRLPHGFVSQNPAPADRHNTENFRKQAA